MRDKPWIFRTYAGHSSAQASNALYRTNLSKGQTGLSVAFDLPTQTGYDADHVLSKGEVGKVGVPIGHLGDMRTLFDGIPLETMNTSMTINATAPWLLALYLAVAEEQGAPRAAIQGTTQNDLTKEYLSRGTYIFPPGQSMRLTTDMIAFTSRECPKWNPMNVCSYHLQEAGATPGQELAYALATATAVLDALKASGQVEEKDFPLAVGRISFFVNAGVRFITEMCKMRAFAEMWDAITANRYGVADQKQRLFRYGVQVNSLGLTEQQPENNVYRILLEMLAVTLSKKARARAVQLPAWNEALGLPRPWDQQWSLRLQQIVAYETDLLEYDDLFDGSPVITAKVEALKEEALAELARIEAMGGATSEAALAYMKERLVESNTARLKAIETGEQMVIGVNAFKSTEPSPLSTGDGAIMVVDAKAEHEQIERVKAWRAERDERAVSQARAELSRIAREGGNIMPVSIAAAKAGLTTGEWAECLRSVYGQYRGPTGVAAQIRPSNDEGITAMREKVAALGGKLGHKMRVLVGKPGLDGHSNGAEQLAVRAKDVGMDVAYEGIRFTPEELIAQARENRPDLIGVSILSGSHVPLVEEFMGRLKAAGLSDIPVVAGGIIPPEDAEKLKAFGVARIYTPKDFDLNAIMGEWVELVAARLKAPAA
ncbi:MAG: protein meaA [Alphaproteobacteria bacterium]|nr:protein meaA [Alphaproteobacteria bacterium]